MDTAAELLRLIFGYRISQAIHVAAVLGLSDHLFGGPRTVAELAEDTGCDSRSLYRLLRALAAIGVYEELPDGRFASTPMGDELRRDSDSQLGSLAEFVGVPSFWQAWGVLEHSVRTGDSAYTLLLGQDVWAYRAQHPEESAIFDAAMTAQSRRVAGAVVAAYDFGGFATIADIGGGRGAMLAAVLSRNPDVRGVLLDQPHVVAGAPALLARAGVAERCQIVAGDMFDAVPAADAYLLKAIVHDWNDEQAVAILSTCRRAMSAAATLLIIERVLGATDHGAGAASAAFSDLNMLVAPGGMERTQPEFEALLSRAGMRLTRVVPTSSDVAVIEARVHPPAGDTIRPGA